MSSSVQSVMVPPQRKFLAGALDVISGSLIVGTVESIHQLHLSMFNDLLDVAYHHFMSDAPSV